MLKKRLEEAICVASEQHPNIKRLKKLPLRFLNFQGPAGCQHTLPAGVGQRSL
jgi:hypothetical protein